MSYHPWKDYRLPILEELEPRWLLATLTPLPAGPVSNTTPAIVSPTQTPQPGPTTGTGNLAAGTQGNQTGATPAQTFAAGNQSAFVTTTPTGVLPGAMTPGPTSGPANPTSRTINPVPNLSQSVVGQNPTLAYNTLQQQYPNADPFNLRLAGGSRGLVDQNPPYNPRLGESEPDMEEVLPNPEGPANGAPNSQPAEPNVPPPPANPPGQPEDLSSETPAQATLAVDDVFANLPQTGQDLVPGLDELVLTPGVLELALASSMPELAP